MTSAESKPQEKSNINSFVVAFGLLTLGYLAMVLVTRAIAGEVRDWLAQNPYAELGALSFMKWGYLALAVVSASFAVLAGCALSKKKMPAAVLPLAVLVMFAGLLVGSGLAQKALPLAAAHSVRYDVDDADEAFKAVALNTATDGLVRVSALAAKSAKDCECILDLISERQVEDGASFSQYRVYADKGIAYCKAIVNLKTYIAQT